MNKTLMLITLAAVAAACNSQRADPNAPRVLALDGSTFTIQVQADEAARKAGEKDFKDTLIFESGRFRSTECEPVGYRATPYTAKENGKAWTFESSQHSDQDGDTVWMGTVSGERVEGSFVHTGKDGRAHRATFSGSGSAAMVMNAYAPRSAPAWDFNATIIEACSCPMFCQCYFNSKPAGPGCCSKPDDPELKKRFCRFNNAFHVNHGASAGVKLDGAKFWVAGDLGSDFSEGKMGWAVMHFDPAVTPSQRDAISAIVGHLYPVKWDSLTVGKDASIDWHATRDHAEAKLDGGKMGEVQLKKNPGMSDDPIVIKNLKYWGAQRNEGFVLMANEVEAYRSGEKQYEFKGTNGFMITVDLNADDVAGAKKKGY
jgi:hypothetical protein